MSDGGKNREFARQALGHNSKPVQHACSKHAEVTVPSLDDWEKEWVKIRNARQTKLPPVEFRSPLADIAQSNQHSSTTVT